MKSSFFVLCALTAVILAAACNSKSSTEKEPGAVNKAASYKEEMVTVNADSADMNCFLVYNENDTAKRPAILVVPEWWGLNDYAKMRARKLAELGYIAMAVDVYGGSKTADNPQLADSLAKPFYMNPQKAKTRIDAAMAK
jgi:dienelactone hydrolase